MEIRQIIITGERQVELSKLELDEKMIGKNELLIDTEYTFVSAGTELANYTAQDPNVFKPGMWCSYPWKAGYANVGRVHAIGAEVSGFSIGQRVFSYGPHASAFRYDLERMSVEVPDDIQPGIAAASRMAGVALGALPTMGARDDPWVVVFGLGIVGNITAQSFGIRGYRVIGVDPVATRRELAMACGVSYVVGGGEPDDVQATIEMITAEELAGVCVDAVGHSAVIGQALRATAPYGSLMLLGTPRVAIQGNITEMWTDIHMRMITVRGALEWDLPMYPDIGGRVSQQSKQNMIFDWIRRGKLQIEPLISHCMRPAQIRDVYDGLLNHKDEYTGVLLDWREG